MARSIVLSLCLCPALLGQVLEKEMALGRELCRELEQHKSVVEAPPVASYVRELSVKLDGTETTKVINDSEAAAFAFPGGFVYLSTGLITRTETEAELAGVLAHAMAHNRMRPEALAPRDGVSIFLECARWPRNRLPPGLIESVLRREARADEIAVELARAAGFDPIAMIEFFAKLRYDYPDTAKYSSVDELIALRTHVEDKLPPNPQYVVTSTAFAAVRAAVESLKAVRPSPERPTLEKRKR